MAFQTFRTNTVGGHSKKYHASKSVQTAIGKAKDIKSQVKKGKNMDTVQYEIDLNDVKSELKLSSLKSVDEFVNSLPLRE